jgi:hypothetical protein
MNKLQLEKKIAEECKALLAELKQSNQKFDENGLKALQIRLWEIGDKYGTDGANVFNICMKHFNQIDEEQ